MKKILLILLFSFAAAVFAENLIKNGDFTNVKHKGLHPECGTNGGKCSLFTEESTWNKCGKLEITKITKNSKGHEIVSAYVWIGGDKSKGGGFPVKPDTTYRFSVEVKGSAPNATICVTEWNGPRLWHDMKTIKTTVGNIKVMKDWTIYKGTFKTTSKAQRAALGLQMWWSTQWGPQKFKVGDYILFDNVKIEEDTNKIAPQPAKTDIKTETKKSAKTTAVLSMPVIDGKLSETAWNNASEIADFVILKKKLSPMLKQV